MIRYLLIIALLGTLYADDIHLESSIFATIVQSVTKKKAPKVYIYKKIPSVLKYPNSMKIVKDCALADIVLLSSIQNIPKECKGKVFFGSRYKHLKNPQVVGAFFWQKGRPNILFYKNRLEKYHITLDKSYDKYIETE